MHQITGRWKLGLAMALTTAALWGILPVALKIALQGLDPYTVTWYRFAVAGIVLTALLTITGGLPSVRGLGKHHWQLLALALFGLVGNYVLYLVSLRHLEPAAAQVVIQLGPMFFLLGGVVIFRERFSRLQLAGLVILILGLTLFFNRRLPLLLNITSGIGFGVVLVVVSAVCWAAYGLAQKQLLKRFKPQQILLLIYFGAIALLLPASHPQAILDAAAPQLWAVAFACTNTLIGYGAFAEALAHWEVSRVGAVVATAPLFTLAAVWIMDRFAPGLIPPESLNALSVIGALLVVGGSAVCALSASAPTKERLDV